ncbi:actin-like ATPase domain-containing protein [Rhizophagus irregularis]|uniref:Actin-like ATPase domain-containing protein n=1 Tax=Rhizophagus irregularis TaxID=588596 RepID=A0A2N0S2R3_9GLOM|nr:actin-like ATPase domain-containing protein [Rhizophagus irregularis]CAB5126810.1 unnamed protein product [Rhizophagus irregularis]
MNSEPSKPEAPEGKVFDAQNSVENYIRVVVGLDFGTTYSGFAYCNVADSKVKKNCIISNDSWQGEVGQLKTNTVLQYDDEYNDVILWGAPALAKKPSRRHKKKNDGGNKPIERFKLHLGDLPEEFIKQTLQSQVKYDKAITDYLREIGKVIKTTVEIRWPKLNYFEHVLLVITVPAEFSEKSKAIMRKCAFNAELIDKEDSVNLQFTTEPEAAAIYCMKNDLKEQSLAKSGTNFMIVDCGGGTVDLTTRKLLKNDRLSEVTERVGGFCGSTFIDDEFIKYLRKKLGDKPMDLLRDKNYGQMQYLIQQFCTSCKIPFTGEDPEFSYELDIQIFKQYKHFISNKNNIKEELEENEWVIEIDFEAMESIFEPVIQKIFCLIEAQLRNMCNTQETCSAMYLVGGFSESKYLQNRIREKFSTQVKNISVPIEPMAAIARGAVIYGLSICPEDLRAFADSKRIVFSRVLKHTYGIKSTVKWEKGDPANRKVDGDRIEKFQRLAKRGTIMEINQEVTSVRKPIDPDQTFINHSLYYTDESDGEYCDEPGMKPLGTLYIDLPGSGLGRRVEFGLTFGKMEITATSRNRQTGESYKTTFELNLN